MHRSKRLAILLALSLFMGSTVGTSAMAAETVEEVTSAVSEEAASEAAEEDASSESSGFEDESEAEEAATAEETEITVPDEKEEETEVDQEIVSADGEAADDNEDTVDNQDKKGDEEILEETYAESKEKAEEDIPAEEPVVESEADAQEVSNEAKSESPGDYTIGEGYLDATEIFVGDEVETYLDSAYVYYKFTPEEDGFYSFYSSTEEGVFTYAGLYDDDLKFITSDDMNGGYGLFYIAENLEASRTYYLRVYAVHSSGNCTIHLKKNSFYAKAVEEYINAYVGDEVTLSVEALSEYPIEYQWYDNDDNLIEGAENSDYSFTPNHRGNYQYSCIVTDGNDSLTVNFYVWVQNEVRAEAVCSLFEVNAGEEITLETVAYSLDGSYVYYEWYDENYELIDGEDESSLSIVAEKTCQYTCRAWVAALGPGESGLYTDVRFNIIIKNQLEVYPEGASVGDDGAREKEVYIDLDASEQISLKVIVNAEDTSGLVFDWERLVAHGYWGWPTSDYVSVENNNSGTLILSNPQTGIYKCEVTDRFGNKGEAIFHVSLEDANHLSVYPEGAGTTNGIRDKYVRLRHQQSETVTFKTIATADDTSQLNYEWYEGSFYETGWSPRTEFNGNTEISIEIGERSYMYKCVVTDQYGNHDIAFFEVVANNLILSSANGEVEHEYDNGSYITVKKLKGEDLTLKTIATADDTSNIEYDWSSYIDGESRYGISYTDSYVVTLDTPASYTCEVTDGYYNNFFLHYNVEIVDCLNHEYGEWTVTQEATCTEDGSRERTCAICGHKETETIPSPGHVWEEEYRVDIEATCVDEGYESIHCSVCHESNPDTVRVIERKAHDFSDWKVIEEPTCTRDGSQERVCNNCGYKETETIPAPGHKWDEEYTVGKEATCTEEGYEAIFCSVCHIFDESTYHVIPKKEHAFGEWEVTKKATCTEDGSRERVCAVCGYKETEIIPATGHVWDDVYTVDIEATCVDEGYESIHCTICGKSDPDSVRVIERKAHDFGDWKVTEEATCTRDGSRERVCNYCGYKETETITAPGHKWNEEYTIGKEATCTEEGYEAIFCSVCHIFDESTYRVIPKKEHTCEEWTVTKEATCTEDGSREGVCEYCGTEMTETIPATGHIWNNYYTRDVEPTETEEGSESKHCSVCDAIDESTVRPIPVLKGTWRQDRNGWWYDRGNGTYPKDGFEEIKGVTYYFDASGYMKTGWVEDDGDWYYFAASGAMVKDNWQQSGSTWYYFGEDGKMLTGLQEIDGTSYFFKDSGAMATGWQQIDGDWYFFAGSGAMVKKNWQQSGNIWYYFGEDGKMLTGLQEINGTSYFFKDSGAMATGWQQIDGAWYYFNAGGAMVKGNWQQSGNTWYYFDGEGKMLTGLQEIEGKTYFFKDSGAMVTGWQQVGDDWYFFESSGAAACSKWVGNYYMLNSGVMATNQWVDNDRYYVGADGKWIPGYGESN